MDIIEPGNTRSPDTDAAFLSVNEWAIINIAIGAVLLILIWFLSNVFYVSTGTLITIIAVSTALIGQGAARLNEPWLTFKPDLLQIRISTYGSQPMSILYSEVRHVDIDSEFLMIHYSKHNAPAGEEPKKIKIKFGSNMLKNPAKKSHLLDTLHARLPPSVFDQSQEAS